MVDLFREFINLVTSSVVAGNRKKQQFWVLEVYHKSNAFWSIFGKLATNISAIELKYKLHLFGEKLLLFSVYIIIVIEIIKQFTTIFIPVTRFVYTVFIVLFERIVRFLSRDFYMFAYYISLLSCSTI